MANDWRLFHGDDESRANVPFPPPPPWRKFHAVHRHRGQTFQAGEHEIQMINAAIYLRRPLLVTGPPGSGKSSLIYAVAKELGLGDVLRWPINSKSTLTEGLYRYDAIARLRDANLARARVEEQLSDDQQVDQDVGQYITLGPLGTALLPGPRPRALLIDELDKSDIDLPNDLLHVFEEGRFEIPELVRASSQQPLVKVLPANSHNSAERVTIDRGQIQAAEFPVVVITSNGERDLPPAFLRRCLRLNAPRPDEERLQRIVRAHLGQVDDAQVADMIREFLAGTDAGRLLAIDQLLNSIFLLTAERSPEGFDRDYIRESLMRSLDEE